ncbi:protein kinase domain-containing protein [Ktedonobacter racemifer]|uniref:non-specific serine/threonine protein kinase n=1 Tax=Ktedonobacter racemifer DSM 44963 TaxID=485913 RepID=D6TRQ9_KTERA|nr:protein kinase [Ktedonobacter racemifer]EFH86011.1 serine/threonine protein kinase [Ktedonobacter racemifer DSM 44963]
MMVDRVGAQFGSYQLVRLLGEGSYAEVYLGQHLYLERQAAIKVQQTAFLYQDVQAFLQEARTIAALNHPNIVHVLDFGLEGRERIPFLVVEYAPHGTLRQRCERGNTLSLLEVVACIKQLAAALQYAHERGIVHRDVKPENVLIGAQGQYQLSDFGIAVILRSSYLRSQPHFGGTVAYMAPEQHQGNPCAASDQYALAVIAYELLTGAPPFQGTLAEIGSQHLFADIPSLRAKRSSLPLAVEQVIQTALAKEPQQRFSTVETFALALAEAANTIEASSEARLSTTTGMIPVPAQQVDTPVHLLTAPLVAVKQIASWLDVRMQWNLSSVHKRYCHYLLSQHRDLDVKGLGTQSMYTLALEQVFVELSMVPTPVHQVSADPLRVRPDLAPGEHQIWDFLASPALQQQHFVVVGSPGSGKTTLLKHMVLTLASRRRLEQGSAIPTKLPVLLFLRDHAQTIKRRGERYTLEEAAADHHKKYWRQSMPAGWLKQRLESGNCLIFLDGIDEVADLQARKQVVNWVQQQMLVYGQNRFIITSRPFGYRSNPLTGVTVLEMSVFTRAQVERFIYNWYQANEIMSAQRDDLEVRAKARSGADDLLGRLYENPALIALAVNPLLLTMIATVHRYRDTLPVKRVMLYDEICDVFLGKRQEAKGIALDFTVAQKREVLRSLAFSMLCMGIRDIPFEDACRIIQAPLSQLGTSLEPAAFLRQLENTSGLLLEREQGVYSFAHLTFQEYLAAVHIKEEGLGNFLVEQIAISWWHETIRLYCAQADATPVIAACLDAQTSVATLTLALECQREALKVQPEVRLRLETLLKQGVEDSDVERRRLITNVLLTRRLQQMLHLHGEVYLNPSFVTCAEYQLFLDEQRAQGNNCLPDHLPISIFEYGQGHMPVLGMRPTDAVAFCDWLNGREPGAWYYRLPTHAEARLIGADKSIRSRLSATLGYWVEQGQGFAWVEEGASSPEAMRRILMEVYKQDLTYNSKLSQELEQTLTRVIECVQALLKIYGKPVMQDMYKILLHIWEHELPLQLVGDIATILGELLAQMEPLLSSFYHALSGAYSLAETRESERALMRVRKIQFRVEQAQALKRAIQRAHVVALASSMDLDQGRPLSYDRLLTLACTRENACNLDRGRDLAPTFAFMQEHLAAFVRNSAREFQRVRLQMHELERMLAFMLDRSRLMPLYEEASRQNNESEDYLRRYVRSILLSLALYVYDWWARPSGSPGQGSEEHSGMVAGRGLQQAEASVERVLGHYLDLYIALVLLEKRIQGQMAPHEGILLVRERRTKQ